MSFFKSHPVRSQRLRDSARGQNCTLRVSPYCDHDQTVVLCHLPFGGRGMARKNSDINAVFGCAACHDYLDSRVPCELSEGALYRAVIRAHAETLQIWVDEGLVTVRGNK